MPRKPGHLHKATERRDNSFSACGGPFYRPASLVFLAIIVSVTHPNANCTGAIANCTAAISNVMHEIVNVICAISNFMPAIDICASDIVNCRHDIEPSKRNARKFNLAGNPFNSP